MHTLGLAFLAGAGVAVAVQRILTLRKHKRSKQRLAAKRGAAVVEVSRGQSSAEPARTKSAEDCDREENDDDGEATSSLAAPEEQTNGVAHYRQPPDRAEFYLMFHHVSKRHNIGSLIRTAAAFGCAGIIVVGMRKSTGLSMFGSFGSDRRVKIHCFLYMDEAIRFLKALARSQGRPDCIIYGIEIMDQAKDVSDPSTFTSLHQPLLLMAEGQKGKPSSPSLPCNACFIPGNEGHGLTAHDRKHCNEFVVIPQFGSATASLNVAAAVAVVLYQFATRAGYVAAPREGEKFCVCSIATAAKAISSGDSAVDGIRQAVSRSEGTQDETKKEEAMGEGQGGDAALDSLALWAT
jgi:tRNA G18 (ribose-2'-O)-methylase SpoU